MPRSPWNDWPADAAVDTVPHPDSKVLDMCEKMALKEGLNCKPMGNLHRPDHGQRWHHDVL